ncbi:MAG: divalent-cation tolerance protein CutA [Elusimicrobiota bacterium]
MSLSNRYAVVFVTTANKKEAEKIADVVVKKRLVACVNIVEQIESIYWWQNKIEKSSETLLMMKTRFVLAKKLIKKIKSLHSYSVPEIIMLPVLDGNPEYLKWIREETKL